MSMLTTKTTFFRDKAELETTFSQVSAVIHLAHKYHVEDMLSQALSVLKSYYKDDFGKYNSDSEVSLNFEATSKNHHIGAVNLVCLTNTPSNLPFALYRYCELSGAVVDGYKREDGFIGHLTTKDLRLYIDGCEGLAEEAFSMIQRLFRPQESEECGNNGKLCRAAIGKLFIDAVENDDASASPGLPRWKLVIGDRANEGTGTCRRGGTFGRGFRKSKWTGGVQQMGTRRVMDRPESPW